MGGWNRATRRRMSKFGLGEQEMQKRLAETWEKSEENAERFAFAGMILALVQKFGFPADQVHDLAVETMRNIHGGFCASQLVDKVKELTGFDVDEPLDDFEVNFLEDTDEDFAG